MGGGQGQQQQTPAQQAQMQVANNQMQDWQTRWLPVLSTFSKQVDQNNAPGSAARERAIGAAGADTSVKFAGANDQALGLAAANGAVGSAKQKLGIVGMGNDEATSAGNAALNANQAEDSSYIANEGNLAGVGRGVKGSAENAMGQEAALSSNASNADAQRSLEENAGYAGLAAKAGGIGAGLWMGGTPPPGFGTSVSGTPGAGNRSFGGGTANNYLNP